MSALSIILSLTTLIAFIVAIIFAFKSFNKLSATALVNGDTALRQAISDMNAVKGLLVASVVLIVIGFIVSLLIRFLIPGGEMLGLFIYGLASLIAVILIIVALFRSFSALSQLKQSDALLDSRANGAYNDIVVTIVALVITLISIFLTGITSYHGRPRNTNVTYVPVLPIATATPATFSLPGVVTPTVIRGSTSTTPLTYTRPTTTRATPYRTGYTTYAQ